MTETVHRPLQAACNGGGGVERIDYGSAKVYADQVRTWVGQTQMWMLEQQRFMLQNMRPIFPAPPGAIMNLQQQNIGGIPQGVPGRNGGIARRIMFRIGLNGNGMEPQFQTIITQEYQIPSFAKRAAAEMLDFLLLFFFKMVFVYFLVELELVDIDQYVKILSDDVDLSALIDITQGLFHLELCAKVICGIIEAYCISFGLWNYPAGCTPGKYLMRIQVVSCINILPVPGTPNRVTVSRHPTVPFGK
uniref:RDD domain-containing protein n=1 Tax=Panagrolaimus superbus TaxID=310955 RepID=A0A914Z4B3_9BILA